MAWDAYALLIAASLNAGTVLALAALGLLINEKAGVVNLGAEGMMLCAAGDLKVPGPHRSPSIQRRDVSGAQRHRGEESRQH
jgi:hypothetical protein